jgi:hypothetical protein
MLSGKIKAAPVKTSTIILACILLVGVITMAYGFYHNDSHVGYVGLFITCATSWTIFIRIILTQRNN